MSTFTIPTLETERLILRAPCAGDMEHEYRFYASKASHFVGGPISAEQTWRTIASVIGHWMLRGFGLWALEEKATGTYQGRTGLWHPEGWPEREIGWTLMEHGQGKGYATEAALKAREYAYTKLGWKTAISLIDPANEGSINVAKRLSATPDGTFKHERFGHMHVWRHPGPEAA